MQETIKKVIIREGLISNIRGSLKSAALYLLIPYLVFGISSNSKLSGEICFLNSLISLILLNLYLTQVTIVSDLSIQRTGALGVFKKKIELNKISCIYISKPVIPSNAYNYSVIIAGNQGFTMGFFNIKKLNIFINSVKSLNIKLELDSTILNELNNN